MIYDQSPIPPGITPPVGPPETPILPNQPEAPDPVLPDESPITNPPFRNAELRSGT